MYGWITAGLGVAMLLAWGLVGKIPVGAEVTGNIDAPAEVAKRIGAYTTRTLLRGALTEGWGLFGAVSYMITAEPWLLVAPLLAVLLLLRLLPGEETVRELLREDGPEAEGQAPPIEP